MKVPLDSCVWGGAREVMAAAGHDVAWVGDWGRDPGGAAILDRAHAEGRVLITLDKDFGELAIVKGAPHAGIVRLVGIWARATRETPPCRCPRRTPTTWSAGRFSPLNLIVSGSGCRAPDRIRTAKWPEKVEDPRQFAAVSGLQISGRDGRMVFELL